MFRSVLAILAGLLLAMIGIIGVEGISAVLHPCPPGLDMNDMEACKAHVARYPTSVLVLVVFLWGAIVLVSTWLATRIGTARHFAHGVIVGTILLAAVAFNMAMLPYPQWFWVNLIVFPVCAWWGTTLAQGDRHRRQPAGDDTTAQ